jgi:hypothetical protein
MTEYDYTIVQDVEGYPTITLTQLSTGKVKVFPLRCTKHTSGLHRHMCSLTDDLCSSWFNERVRKPKKEKAAGC